MKYMANWQTKLLKQLYTPLSNLSYARECLTETPQRLAYIHYGDIHTNKIAEVVSAETAMSFLLDSISISSEEKYLLKEGDIVLVDASEDYEGVGKSIEISAIQNKKIVAGLHTIALRPIDATNLAPGFGRYLLKHPLVSKRLKAIAQGTKVFSISFTLIQKLKVLLPPIEEQRKIVEVLETWDKAIGLTKQLIEQKELQKKYLMQQLLTGRTRLKGFTGKWEIYSLSQIVTPINCLVGNKQLVALSISAKVGFVPQKEKFGRDISGEQYTKYTLLKYGNFAYNKGNSYTYPQGCVYRLENYKEAAVPNVFECFSANEQKVSPLYLKQYFKANLHSKQLLRLINSGVRNNGLLNLSSTDFYSIKLELPSLREQNKITGILSSCDKEIDLLKQKLTKLEEQKKGLMQVLLTGKVRLK